MSEFSRKTLLSMLEVLKYGLADKESVPQSMSFVFDGDRVYTYNDNVGVCVPFESGMKCAVPGMPFLTLLRKLKKDDIMLDLTDKGLTVKQGKRVSATLAVNADIMLPFDEHVKPPAKMSKLPCTAEAFAEGVRFVLFSVSKDQGEQRLCGVHVGYDQKGTFVESSDRYRFTRRYVSENTSSIDMKIPTTTADALLKLEPIKFGENEGWIYFECKDGVQFASWTAAEDYPNIAEAWLAVKESSFTTVEFPEKIADVIDLASNFAASGVMNDSKLHCVIEGGKATIFASGPFGKYKESLKVEADADVTFNLNPTVFAEALSLSRKVKVSENYLMVASKKFWHAVLLNVAEENDGYDGEAESGE